MTAFDAGIAVALEKVAARKRDRESPAKDIGLVAGGGALAAGARHGVLGTQRVYHGTTADRWREIRKSGLDPRFGGTGSAAHSGHEGYVKGSKGKVHVTRSKSTAGFFAGYGKRKTGEKGKVVPINMDYDKYMRMEIDPDMIAGAAPERMKRYFATRGTEAITPEEIKGSTASLGAKARRRLSKLPGYIRKYPGRFGAGLGVTGLGAYMAQRGARNLAKRYREKK